MVDGSDIEHRKGSFGVAEPIGDPLPESTIRDATTILVPALAIDREGRRLGRGGGHYDRSLPLANPNTRRVAIVRDEEFVDHLRTEPHDFRVTGVITPTRGYVEL
jgi:5-formyltetrahydrofolate cyclo-ligase